MQQAARTRTRRAGPTGLLARKGFPRGGDREGRGGDRRREGRGEGLRRGALERVVGAPAVAKAGLARRLVPVGAPALRARGRARAVGGERRLGEAAAMRGHRLAGPRTDRPAGSTPEHGGEERPHREGARRAKGTPSQRRAPATTRRRRDPESGLHPSALPLAARRKPRRRTYSIPLWGNRQLPPRRSAREPPGGRPAAARHPGEGLAASTGAPHPGGAPPRTF